MESVKSSSCVLLKKIRCNFASHNYRVESSECPKQTILIKVDRSGENFPKSMIRISVYKISAGTEV